MVAELIDAIVDDDDAVNAVNVAIAIGEAQLLQSQLRVTAIAMQRFET
jgi:hypothetical protein